MITPVLSTVTAKEVPAHHFDNVLELHSDNVAALKAHGGLWNYKKLHATAINSLDKKHNNYIRHNYLTILLSYYNKN